MMTRPFCHSEFALIARQKAALMGAARERCGDYDQLQIVERAIDFACKAHKDRWRRRGEPFVLHPIAVARIAVEELGLGYKSICAAVLHNIIGNSHYSLDDIRQNFGDKIASLVDGLRRIKTVLDYSNDFDQYDNEKQQNIKIMLLTLGDDARVVLIKLGDRLHDCRRIEYFPEKERRNILEETMLIFIPLAHRLGLYSIKSEMENIWLRFNKPDAYNSISQKINANARNRDKIINDFLVPIKSALDMEGLEYTIKKRIKSPYSIWYKIENKHVSFDQISDIFAVRIIFKPSTDDLLAERNECFHIFDVIKGLYSYRPDRVRDWVMAPKENGYEALHLTAVTDDGTNIEVQIRSQRMDDIAEKGISAHWNYKNKHPHTSENRLDKWLARIKERLEHHQHDLLEITSLTEE